jgi:hypothetical protein
VNNCFVLFRLSQDRGEWEERIRFDLYLTNVNIYRFFLSLFIVESDFEAAAAAAALEKANKYLLNYFDFFSRVPRLLTLG